VTPQPFYDMEAVERAAAELDSGRRGGDRLGDAVRNLAKLLDKTTAELEAANHLSLKNGFEAARLAPFEHKALGWQKHAAKLEKRGEVWRGWALGLQDWAEGSLRVDPTPTDRWDLGWNAALRALCISIISATLGDFPYLVDPDCECEGRCPMCARWGCEQCCDGEMPADHGVKGGTAVRSSDADADHLSWGVAAHEWDDRIEREL